MSSYLSSIHSPDDVKKLSQEQLEELCAEIRQKIISTVSVNGGHLASNLGSVELTVSLLKVFSPPEDKIIWDVGHQAYAYKLLTGRAETFHTLRQMNGISGFPNRQESVFDHYTSGHASTSVSAALGFSAADAVKDQHNSTIAVIGDGALTGGLAYEGLNNAGRLARNFIVILNDNQMSISKNVGSIAKYLAHLRTSRKYLMAKGRIEKFVGRIPVIGTPLYSFLSKSKDVVKRFLYGSNLFRNLGFEYYGPFDGHDIKSLIDVLENAKNIDKPVLLHVLTAKGKGYEPAEKNPGEFHGVSSFNVETGEVPSSLSPNFSSVFGKELCQLAEEDETVCAITAAMKFGTGLDVFAKKFKNRFFDIGIAEEHAVTFACGLAAGGMKPVFAVYSTFLQRSYDQLIHDAALQKVNMTIAVDRAGIVGDDGETHQGVFDAAFLSTIPGIRIYSPTYFDELSLMLRKAVQFDGISAVRYPRGGELYKPEDFQVSTEDFILYPDKKAKILIVTYGRLFSHACLAVEKLKAKGYCVSVLKLNVICPLSPVIYEAICDASYVFSFEEGVLSGGVGEHLAAMLMERGYKGKLCLRGVDNTFVKHGKPAQLFELLGLDPVSMTELIENTVKENEELN